MVLQTFPPGQPDFPSDTLVPPITLSLQQTKSGRFVFRFPRLFVGFLGDDPGGTIARRGGADPRARLWVEDYVSGELVRISVPGKHQAR